MAKDGHSVEFLLTEHKLIQESFWRNEESGEKRVNFFITLVTAVIAALVALGNKWGLSSKSPSERPWPTVTSK